MSQPAIFKDFFVNNQFYSWHLQQCMVCPIYSILYQCHSGQVGMIKECSLGWSDLALVVIFEIGQIVANQVLF